MAIENSQVLSLDFSIEPMKIARELQLLETCNWTEHVNRNYYNGNWSVLPLRSLAEHKNSHPVLQSFQIESGTDWQDLPLMSRLTEITKIVSAVKCAKKSVRLMKLDKGAEIKTHRDKGLCIESGEARLHVPLQSNDEVEFISNNKVLPMEAFQLWYINADQEHSVRNSGTCSRINLVMDCEVNDWLLSRLDSHFV